MLQNASREGVALINLCAAGCYARGKRVRRRACMPPCSSAQKPDVLDLRRLYTSQLYTPPQRFLADVDLELISGKGVGMRTRQDFRSGDLIGAFPPLGVVYGPQGSIPDNEALADALMAQQLTPEQLRWLQLLHAGNQQGQGGLQDPARLQALRQLLLGLQQPEDDPLLEPAAQSPPQPPQAQQPPHLLAPSMAQAQAGADSAITLPPPALEASAPTLAPAKRAGSEGGGMQGRAAAGKQQQGRAAAHSPGLDGALWHGSGSGGQHVAGVRGVSIEGVVGRGGGAGEGGAGQQHAKGPPRAWVLEALSCHTAGDSCEDVAVAQLRQQEPLQSYCGLWPEFALLNHSCSPNTVHLIVGGWLLLRAARPISQGAELTTCHIGAGRFQHVASRRSQLQREYGFHCTCGRCTLEHHFFPTRRYPRSVDSGAQAAAEDFLVAETLRARRSLTQILLDGMFGKGRFQTDVAREPQMLMLINKLVLNHLEPELDQAVSATTRLQEKRKSVLSQCTHSAAAVEQGVQELGLALPLASLLRASVFELYRLQVELHELLPDLVDAQDRVAALQQAVRAADAVARGTEAHVQLAVRLMQKVRSCYGSSSVEAREAELACAAAHHCRYGRVDPSLLRSLVQVRQQRAVSASLAQRLGVLAWDDQAGSAMEEEGVSM